MRRKSPLTFQQDSPRRTNWVESPGDAYTAPDKKTIGTAEVYVVLGKTREVKARLMTVGDPK